MKNNPCVIRFALLLVILAGCAGQPPMEEESKRRAWEDHLREVSSFTNWDISGRISVQLQHEAWSASIRWQQDKQEYFMRLTAPLGRGTYEIYGNADEVFLRTGKDEILKAPDPKSLMEENFGWHVPIDGLVYWVRGIPDVGQAADALSLDNEGRLSDLSQSGWLVSCSRYSRVGDYLLPGRVTLENDKLKVRLVIKDWKS